MNRLFSSSVQAVKMPFRKVSHVIFDMDGLLLDTEKIYEQLIREIAQSFDKPYPFDVRLKLMGTTEQKTAEIAVADLGLPITVPEFLKIFAEKGNIMLADTDLMKGAERLVRHLHAHKIPIAVATSSGADLVEIKTKKHQDLFALFDHKVCGSSDPEVKKGKPAPDIFLITASRFPDKPNPNTCLVFEDAPNGVQGAVAAGMQCVMVPDVNCPEEQRKLANLVLHSLEEVNLADFGLPPLD